MPSDATLPELLRPKEVAGVLRESLASTYRRLERGELQAVRLGHRGPLRVRADELEHYLAEHTEGRAA